MKRIIAIVVGLLAAVNSNLLSTSSLDGIILPLLAVSAFLYLLISTLGYSSKNLRDDSSMAAAGITLSDIGCGGDIGGGDS
ncbi:hypothetical protein BOW53_15820 [Solemya pervernicosa gill symbiont]|uniref:Uncharacterized protein n=2 Tax=Gammaproteobacteria incertae sedis TaxID=118884 RepID=A0A1T2KZT8_9GAMM|nr:hypothetical protein [Candidatus Reidiella endopervernicosa]OOZ38359.1 hypothetical protein BOW53_15820 [Solemya pervernicosa gill symbiont]QKQ27873.1 hypothetical protein HUE57_17500 [Candidatus Reidiella endopervernicosa]